MLVSVYRQNTRLPYGSIILFKVKNQANVQYYFNNVKKI